MPIRNVQCQVYGANFSGSRRCATTILCLVLHLAGGTDVPVAIRSWKRACPFVPGEANVSLGRLRKAVFAVCGVVGACRHNSAH